jgi:hypothetical protein
MSETEARLRAYQHNYGRALARKDAKAKKHWADRFLKLAPNGYINRPETWPSAAIAKATKGT